MPGQAPGGQLGGQGAQPQGTTAQVERIDVSQFDPVDSKGYPPNLKVLVEGVQAAGGTADGDKVMFLRRIPLDPMTPADRIDTSDDNFGWVISASFAARPIRRSAASRWSACERSGWDSW